VALLAISVATKGDRLSGHHRATDSGLPGLLARGVVEEPEYRIQLPFSFLLL
jgi:hypothetical protein